MEKFISLFKTPNKETYDQFKAAKKNIKLTSMFSEILNGTLEKDPVKIENFREKVLPSLTEPVIISSISNSPRYRCLFELCLSQSKSFASKQKYVFQKFIFVFPV